ncbi:MULTISPECIES: hypothetical protein [Paenibacillus]|uniref:Uncharacterized protein n=1 Tax=Paenibacillus azoreducens TaxID=116718 RepID=A0A919YBM5_9BACL|nr:hypothetical protein [Paenibacillus azoreducens]MBE9916979.1 hypothetical protein [Paenibacillus donghaensis]GIO46025.1 hypothetical protein J34TS1_07900 [Paenibacillus azoreducens]
MNSLIAEASGKGKIAVELTPEEALALTGVKFNGNPEVQAEARRKIRKAFEKTFDFQYEDSLN